MIDRLIEAGPGARLRTIRFKPTFTKSNGTVSATIYERLTKASRRRVNPPNGYAVEIEAGYRQGVYDTLKALQIELS